MSLKNFLLNCFFPKKCYGCHQGDTWLCQKCFLKLQSYQGEIPRALKNTNNLIIAGEYKDPLINNLLIAWKFGFNQELIIPLFAFLKKTIDNRLNINRLSSQTWNNILVVPIPLHKKRLNWRGFNQSEALAREISNYYNWPLSLDLIKPRASQIQAELTEENRLKNQQGVFIWRGKSLTDYDIILVDDITNNLYK